MLFDHEKLDVYKAAIDFVALADPIAEAFPRGRAYLADQLRRAAASIPLNIAEGAGEYAIQDKRRFYRIARRSATECAAILDTAYRLELLDSRAREPARETLLRIVAMLVKISRSSKTGHRRGLGLGHEADC